MRRSWGQLTAALTILFALVTLPVFASTVRVGAATTPTTSGDPFSRYLGGAVKAAVFDGLTSLSNTGQVAPAIALEWQQVSDTEWRFDLRPDVRFHNGQPVTAVAIARQLRYLLSDDAQRHWMAQHFRTVKSVNVLAPLTLSVLTRTPDPLLAKKMSLIRVVDMEHWSGVGEAAFADNPVGTGPFRLDAWGVNRSSATLVAVDHAWRTSKEIERVQYDVVPDGSRRVQALLSGEMDIAINLDADAIAAVEAAGFEIALIEQPIVMALGFRTVNNPNAAVQDPRVRRALNYAVNTARISKYILSDVLPPAYQGTSPGVAGYNPSIEPMAYDKDRARALLEEAGYPHGFDFTVAVWTGQIPGDTLIFQQVAQDLGEVGVRTELRQLPFLDMNRRLAQGRWGDIDAISTVWSSLNLYDSGQAFDTFSCVRAPAPFFCDEELDQLVSVAQRSPTIEQRTAALEDAMRKAVETAASIFLVSYTSVVGMIPQIQNYSQRSDGILFEHITISE